MSFVPQNDQTALQLVSQPLGGGRGGCVLSQVVWAVSVRDRTAGGKYRHDLILTVSGYVRQCVLTSFLQFHVIRVKLIIVNTCTKKMEYTLPP